MRDRLVTGIQHFNLPTNRTDLRTFLGLVNQCGEFTPRISELAAPLRPLLKTTNEFVWDDVHTAAFNATKSELISPPTLSYYRAVDDLRLETDLCPERTWVRVMATPRYPVAHAAVWQPLSHRRRDMLCRHRNGVTCCGLGCPQMLPLSVRQLIRFVH